MATSVTMPALGESVTEGTVTTWLKQVGDTVELDEPIVEVSTDKVDSEVPSPVAWRSWSPRMRPLRSAPRSRASVTHPRPRPPPLPLPPLPLRLPLLPRPHLQPRHLLLPLLRLPLRAPRCVCLLWVSPSPRAPSPRG